MKIFAHLRWLYATVLIFMALTLKIALFRFVRRPRANKIAARFLLRLGGWQTHVEGTPDPQAQMFILNHQSAVDIALLEALTPDRDLAWIAKAELFRMPFLSRALTLSQEIPLERESKSALLALLKGCKDRVQQQRCLCIFPEGTRSESGTMLPFKPGAKLIADKLALRIQPVVLLRTSHFYSNKVKTARPGTITALFLPTVIADRTDKTWLVTLQAQMQAAYDQAHHKELT